MKLFLLIYNKWKKNFNQKVIFITIFWFVLILTVVRNQELPGLFRDSHSFSDGWEYSWFDGMRMDSPHLIWRPYKVGQDFPGHETGDFLLLRNTLPDLDFPNPAIYLTSIDQNFVCYVEGEEIYKFGYFPMESKVSAKTTAGSQNIKS